MILIDNEDKWMQYIVNDDIKSLKKWIVEYERINYISHVTGYSLLSWACKNEKEKIIKFLLESGADPFYRDKKNRMPWILCLMNDWANVKEWDSLYNISHFMENFSTKININNSLPYLIKNQKFEAVRFIFKHISVNEFKGIMYYPDKQKMNFIPYSLLALTMNSKNFLKILIENDYDLNHTGKDNLNIYDYCRFNNNIDWLRFILNLKETPQEQIKIEKNIQRTFERLLK